MSIPNQLSLEALVAEDGMCVRAGLPESVRQELDRLNAAKNRMELARQKRDRLEQILTSVAALEAQIAALHQEYQETLKEYTAFAVGNAA
jgi:hypothetical protein